MTLGQKDFEELKLYQAMLFIKSRSINAMQTYAVYMSLLFMNIIFVNMLCFVNVSFFM